MSQDKTFHECGRIDCSDEGTAMPVLLLRATKGGVAAEAELDLRVCEKHAAESAPDHFVDEKGWDVLVAPFVSRGLARPVRRFTSLKWKRLS